MTGTSSTAGNHSLEWNWNRIVLIIQCLKHVLENLCYYLREVEFRRANTRRVYIAWKFLLENTIHTQYRLMEFEIYPYYLSPYETNMFSLF